MAKKHLTQENLNALVAEALAIEAEEAREAGAVGYMARALTQATLPHRRADSQEFTRTNGNFTLSIIAPSKIGLPFGSIPRLLIAWMTTEAVKTGDKHLILGESMADFMRKLDLIASGGEKGDITRLKEQMRRLFSSTVSCIYADTEKEVERGFRVAAGHVIWWDSVNIEQAGLPNSTVTLTQEFFEEVTASPVPIDMRALKALKQSPMALDMYCWATHRLSYLRKPTIIPWVALQAQFGSNYARTRAFKEAFCGHLRALAVVYPEARLEPIEDGLRLLPSPTHVAKLSR